MVIKWLGPVFGKEHRWIKMFSLFNGLMDYLLKLHVLKRVRCFFVKGGQTWLDVTCSKGYGNKSVLVQVMWYLLTFLPFKSFVLIQPSCWRHSPWFFLSLAVLCCWPWPTVHMLIRPFSESDCGPDYWLKLWIDACQVRVSSLGFNRAMLDLHTYFIRCNIDFTTLYEDR